MKKTLPVILFLGLVFVIPRPVYAQQPATPAYVVPASYTFDYEVVQAVKNSQKKSGGPQVITYHYTKDGDYMAITPEKEPGKFIIFAKGGYNIIIDADKKNLIVMRIGGMIGDLAKSYAEKNKDALADTLKGKGQSVKTGNTKQICGYPAEEYRFTDSKGESSTVWCAKVDFNASLFYVAGMAAFSSGIGGGRPGTGAGQTNQSYPSFSDPHLLLAELRSGSKPDDTLVTQSITKKSMSIDTKGYAVTDMSNMDLKQLMETKSKQN